MFDPFTQRQLPVVSVHVAIPSEYVRIILYRKHCAIAGLAKQDSRDIMIDLQPFLNAAPIVQPHIGAAVCAVGVGPLAVFRRRWDGWHKL